MHLRVDSRADNFNKMQKFCRELRWKLWLTTRRRGVHVVLCAGLVLFLMAVVRTPDSSDYSSSVSHRHIESIPTVFGQTVVSNQSELKIRYQQSPARQLWQDRANCSHFNVRFAAKDSLSVTALTSYPGSGNTWSRYLIESATGVFTGSVYYDTALYNMGFWGEMGSPEDGSTVVQKMHLFAQEDVERFNRTAVVIVRNPYRAILSYHNFLYGGHKGMAPSRNYLKKGWKSFVMKQAFEWSQHLQNWISPGNRVLVVHYELLKADTVAQLRRILHFLNWPVDERRLECLQADLQGQMKRHQQHRPRIAEPFSEDLRHMIDQLILKANRRLQQGHHPAQPLQKYEFFNGSTLRAEILEDCFAEEKLNDCLYRVDKMNFKYHIKSFFEQMRNQVLSSPIGSAMGRVAGGLSDSLARLRAREGRGHEAADSQETDLTPAEDHMVQQVLQDVQKISDGSGRRSAAAS